MLLFRHYPTVASASSFPFPRSFQLTNLSWTSRAVRDTDAVSLSEALFWRCRPSFVPPLSKLNTRKDSKKHRSFKAARPPRQCYETLASFEPYLHSTFPPFGIFFSSPPLFSSSVKYRSARMLNSSLYFCQASIFSPFLSIFASKALFPLCPPPFLSFPFLSHPILFVDYIFWCTVNPPYERLTPQTGPPLPCGFSFLP